jgi:hypothetical protein
MPDPSMLSGMAGKTGEGGGSPRLSRLALHLGATEGQAPDKDLTFRSHGQ